MLRRRRPIRAPMMWTNRPLRRGRAPGTSIRIRFLSVPSPRTFASRPLLPAATPVIRMRQLIPMGHAPTWAPCHSPCQSRRTLSSGARRAGRIMSLRMRSFLPVPTLTIQPGTLVYFDQNRRLTINGRIQALGLASAHITFSHVPGMVAPGTAIRSRTASKLVLQNGAGCGSSIRSPGEYC
jgi:hypothetical protein